jgi:hypothetical protein
VAYVSGVIGHVPPFDRLLAQNGKAKAMWVAAPSLRAALEGKLSAAEPAGGPMSTFLRLGVMPRSESSRIAVSYPRGRGIPMPLSTFGASSRTFIESAQDLSGRLARRRSGIHDVYRLAGKP